MKTHGITGTRPRRARIFLISIGKGNGFDVWVMEKIYVCWGLSCEQHDYPVIVLM